MDISNPKTLVALKKRWWFLGPAFNSEFKNDPFAQAYEVISRHPGFPELRIQQRGRHAAIWNYGPNKRPPKPWPKLSEPARRAFRLEYMYDITRLGFGNSVMLGLKRLSFDCTLATKAILSAVEREMERAISYYPKMKKYFDKGTKERRRTDRSSLPPFRPGAINPDCVILDWRCFISELGKKHRKHLDWNYNRSIILAALETFLTRDADYKRHRKDRLREQKQYQRWFARQQMIRRKRLASTAHSARWGRPPSRAVDVDLRLKRSFPETIALACIAADWQQAGGRQSCLYGVVKAELSHLSIAKCPRWDNHLVALKKLHWRIQLIWPDRTEQQLDTPLFDSPADFIRTLGYSD